MRKLVTGKEKAAELKMGASQFHFVHILIEDKELTLTAYDFNGNTLDTFQTSQA